MDQISNYNNSLELNHKNISDKLRFIIDKQIKNSQSKLYHGSPVWFINDSPIVGYSLKKGKIALLFWSGQSFKESGLTPVGKFKAAEILLSDLSETTENKINTWLEESKQIIWDYKNIRKNNGVLNLL